MARRSYLIATCKGVRCVLLAMFRSAFSLLLLLLPLSLSSFPAPLLSNISRAHCTAQARAGVSSELQFEINGVIRSYNALYPVMVIADFEAKRRPGRFVKDIADDDEE